MEWALIKDSEMKSLSVLTILIILSAFISIISSLMMYLRIDRIKNNLTGNQAREFLQIRQYPKDYKKIEMFIQRHGLDEICNIRRLRFVTNVSSFILLSLSLYYLVLS